jgi:hypothetical protein
MGFTQYDGPYPLGTVIENTTNDYGDEIVDLNLEFPPLKQVEPEGISEVLSKIPFSKPFSTLEEQLKILESIIPPYQVCRLASVLACSLKDKPENRPQQHATR